MSAGLAPSTVTEADWDFVLEHRRRARRHAARRAGERYGLRLEVSDVIEHEIMIRQGVARKLASSSHSSLWRIDEAGCSYFAVYGDDLDCIRTYLRTASDFSGVFVSMP